MVLDSKRLQLASLCVHQRLTQARRMWGRYIGAHTCQRLAHLRRDVLSVVQLCDINKA